MKTAAMTIALIGTLAVPALAQWPGDRNIGGTQPSAAAQRYPSPDWRRGGGYRSPGERRGNWGSSLGFDVGYRDGLDKGREDARDGDRFDPMRHRRYRSADHRYEREYGPKEFYRDAYRQGFLRGYREGYSYNRYDRRDHERYRW